MDFLENLVEKYDYFTLACFVVIFLFFSFGLGVIIWDYLLGKKRNKKLPGSP